MGNNPGNTPQEQKSGSNKLIVIAAAVVLFLGLGGGGYWYASRHGLAFSKQAKSNAPAVSPKDAPPAAVLQLQSFVVNLADPDHTAYLRIGIALGLDKPSAASGDSGKDSPYTPEIRDAVLSVLSTWKSGDLLAPGGRKKLKKQLLQILDKRIPELGVTDIYFTDYLIQQ